MKEPVTHSDDDVSSREKDTKQKDDAAKKEGGKLKKARKSLIGKQIRGFKRKLLKMIKDLENDYLDVSNSKSLVEYFFTNEEEE